MSGGFGVGFLKGALISLIGLSAFSLVAPLTPRDPGSNSQVDLTTPKGSGFNAARTDTKPVLPDTDQSVAKEGVQKPEPGSVATGTPLADTSSASQPTTQGGVELPSVAPGNDDVAMVTSGDGDAPANAVPTTPPALGVPMPAIDNPVREIPVNRLPIVDAPATSVTEPPVVNPDGSQSGDTTAVAVLVPVDPDPPTQAKALLRNKMVFENTGGKPLMSVILIDAGEQGLAKDVLLTFSFPVTFALDPNAAGATADAKIFKQNGFEVLALAPTGVEKLVAAENDTDIDAALSGVFAKLPEAVGLIDGVLAELQQSPELADQIITSLQTTGHGLLTYDIGLNATDQKARKNGVYAGTVFRILDGEGEKSATIKRYLNRAVLEAGKDGHVIVLGRTYPETVTALFSWAVSAKSSTVALAPISASLLAR